MFRKKRSTQKKTLDIYWRDDVATPAISKIWRRIIFELKNDYVEIVDGPKFYTTWSRRYEARSGNGYSGFGDYIRQMGKVSIYVPDNFES